MLSLLLSVLLAPAFGNDFVGSWSGQGFLDETELDAPVSGSVYLSIKASATSLELQECWVLKPGTPKRCMPTTYEVRGDGELWSRGEKVGDMYPYEIYVLDANSQVAEQMTFVFTEPDRIRYQYTYVNMDGQSKHRKGVLTRDPGVSTP